MLSYFRDVMQFMVVVKVYSYSIRVLNIKGIHYVKFPRNIIYLFLMQGYLGALIIKQNSIVLSAAQTQKKGSALLQELTKQDETNLPKILIHVFRMPSFSYLSNQHYF